MIICSAQKISKNYGGKQIFSDLCFDIKEGERIGLVGRNGTGKTTIFKLLTDIETPDSGSIFSKKGLSIGYLEQLPDFAENNTVYETLKFAFKDLVFVSERMKQLESNMAAEKDKNTLQKMLEEYGLIQEKFALDGGYEIDSNIAKVANGLGISQLLNSKCSSLSGGEKTKIGLGLILLTKPELLLLDEPTNHLDISSVEWLESFLIQYKGTVMIISHDRYFLDNVVSQIFDLDDGSLNEYNCNYSCYVKEKEERLLNEFSAYQDQQKKIKKIKEAIKRLREWANQANPPNEGLHRRAASMEKALERMEKLKKPNINPNKIKLSFEVNERSGNDVVIIENISKSFNDKVLFKDTNLLIKYRERTAIIGNNGTGKTTLIKLIINDLLPDKGTIRLGSNVRIGYLSQDLTNINDELTIIEVFRYEIPIIEEKARNILAKFFFYGHSVFKRIKDLSGGEKIRLKLAILMHKDINMLILDEPTNHLDIESREQLEEALANFEGTLICISHDRYFINKLFTTIYWLDNKQINKYEGNYDHAKEKHIQELSKNEIKNSNNVKLNSVKNIPSSKEIEKKIKIIEDKISEINQLMLSTNDLNHLENYQKMLEEMENERDNLYQELANLL